MSIDINAIGNLAGASGASNRAQSAGFQNLGTAGDPLRGPVLVQDRGTGEYFWSQGEVGIFRARDMISELTLVDTSGGVTGALHRMGRTTGRGLEVYGGVNRNCFTVSVPSSEFLTEAGSVTYRVRYHDGTAENVTFHMAPPDQQKQDLSVRRLSGADVVGRDQVGAVLESILSPVEAASVEANSVTDLEGAGAAGKKVLSQAPDHSRGVTPVDSQAPMKLAAELRQELGSMALTSQEQWLRTCHLMQEFSEAAG